MRRTQRRASEWDVTGRRGVSLWRRLSAPQLFVGSFALLIIVGTLGFKVLPGLYTGAPLGWLDALFTATSAACVTGLIVVDTATYFTPAGQAWILLLIQLGGLGMITFTTVIILALGRRMSLRQESHYLETAEVAPNIDYRRLASAVFRFTFVLELTGAMLLYLVWVPRFGPFEAGWQALFHSISAFCNAGFSTFSDNLVGLRDSPTTLVIIMALVVAGGLGFLTLEELYQQHGNARPGQRLSRLSLHSKIVLASTGVLILGGAVLYTVLEWRLTLAEMPLWSRVMNGLFMSVTARTAGFNTVDYDLAGAGTNFVTILLMSIGGSPGSTAGGIKTTTVALIALLAWSRWRGEQVTSVWGRTIPEETVQRAVGLFVVAFVVVTIAIVCYAAVELGNIQHSESAGLLSYMFEAASAFNTVGLSMGVTASLSVPAQWITIVLMYLGRVGPLSFAAAIALPRGKAESKFRFAYEDVVVG